MLELKILAANVLLPTAIVAATLLVLHAGGDSRRNSSKTDDSQSIHSTSGHRLSASIVVLASVLSIWLAFALRVEAGFALWPEDAWARIPVAVGIVGVGSIVALWLPMKTVGWIVRGAALLLAAKTIVPTGEAWEFLRATSAWWMCVLVGSSMLGWWLIERLPGRAAGLLGLGWIFCIAAAAFLSKDFLRVTEPMLAVASVLGCASLGSLLTGRAPLVAGVAGPCLFGSGAAVASAQFNSFLGLPDTLSWLAIASPALAALATLAIASVPAGRGSLSRRGVTLTLVACLALAGVVVAWTFIASGGFGAEEAW